MIKFIILLYRKNKLSLNICGGFLTTIIAFVWTYDNIIPPGMLSLLNLWEIRILITLILLIIFLSMCLLIVIRSYWNDYKKAQKKQKSKIISHGIVIK